MLCRPRSPGTSGSIGYTQINTPPLEWAEETSLHTQGITNRIGFLPYGGYPEGSLYFLSDLRLCSRRSRAQDTP